MSGLRVFLTWVAEQRPGFAVPKIPWPEVEEPSRVRDWVGEEIRVTRAAKDDKTRGVVRGLKTRNTKTVPANEYPL